MKTVIDAVNEFEGEWPFWSDFMCQASARNMTFPDFQLRESHSFDVNDNHTHTCTRKEFLATVAECETNFGKCKQSYHDYKIKFWVDDILNIPKSVNHRCSYSFTDKPTPTYTQAMADNGVSPSVGMECLMDGTKIIYVVVLPADNEGDLILTPKDENGNYWQRLNVKNIKPIKPPITLIDGKAYQFEHNGLVWNGLYIKGGNSMLCSLGNPNVNLCTNIQPLTVEVK
jgi:hypothetical protein